MPGDARWVVVDDADDRVVYDGRWFTQDEPRLGTRVPNANYLSTLHGTGSDGAGLSFSYTGTRIKVYGKLDFESGLRPTWTCMLDDVIIPTRPGAGSFQSLLLCDSGDTLDERHTLTLQINSRGAVSWVDQIHYVPSRSAAMDPSISRSVLAVQRFDPAVQYSSENWVEVDGAIHSYEAGSLVTFHFTGTKVAWIGSMQRTLPDLPATAVYSIDGRIPITFSSPTPANSSPAENQIIFQTPKLPLGPHNLTVMNRNVGTILALDSFLVEDGDPFPVQLPSTASPAFDSVPDSPGIQVVHSFGRRNSAANETRLPLGPLLGGILGGFGALVVLVCVFFCIRKRRSARRVGKVDKDVKLPIQAPPPNLRPSQPKITPYPPRLRVHSAPNKHDKDNVSAREEISTIPQPQRERMPRSPPAAAILTSPSKAASRSTSTPSLRTQEQFERDSVERGVHHRGQQNMPVRRETPVPLHPPLVFSSSTRTSSVPSLHPISPTTSSRSSRNPRRNRSANAATGAGSDTEYFSDASTSTRQTLLSNLSAGRRQRTALASPLHQQVVVDMPPAYTPE